MPEHAFTTSLDFEEAREKFLISWGDICTNWGISKTMGQIHGLLLVSSSPMTMDEIMGVLEISRGNVHTNIKALMDWNLVYKLDDDSYRKDRFIAEKDIWKVLVRIIQQRKEKELNPLMTIVDDYKEKDFDCKSGREFTRILSEISMFSHRTDQVLQHITSNESSWLINSFMKLVR